MSNKWTPYPKPEPGHINVFTDGSFWKSKGIKGRPVRTLAAWCAIVFHTDQDGHTKDKVHKGVCDEPSSFMAELRAIIEAFDLIPDGAPANILTDVEVNNETLNLWHTNNFNNSRGRPLKHGDVRKKIYNLWVERSEIQILTIKGHSKISQQEKTDRIVRQHLRSAIRRQEHIKGGD